MPMQTRTDLPADFEGPETPTEQMLAEIWCEVLQVDRVGVHESFLQLGGDSLGMVKVMNILEKKTGVKVNLRSLFHQSLGQIAAVCEERFTEEAARSGKEGGVLTRLGRLIGGRKRPTQDQ